MRTQDESSNVIVVKEEFEELEPSDDSLLLDETLDVDATSLDVDVNLNNAAEPVFAENPEEEIFTI